MNPFEYLLVLVAVVLGLALSDLAISLNRLLEAGERIKWDWLAPLAAVVSFLKIVTQWWAWFGAVTIAKAITFEIYLGVLASALLLFLLAAAALPDRIDAAPFDLALYYDRVRGRYWLLFAGEWVLSTTVSIWAQMALEGAKLTTFSPFYLIVPAAVALAFVRIRAVHTAAFIILIAIYVGQLFGHGLSH